MGRKLRCLRMTLVFSSCNDCHHAITDTVCENASRILFAQRVWGCTLLIYQLLSDGPEHRRTVEDV